MSHDCLMRGRHRRIALQFTYTCVCVCVVRVYVQVYGCSLGVFGTNDICVLGECTALNIGCNKAAHIYRKTPLPSVRSV